MPLLAVLVLVAVAVAGFTAAQAGATGSAPRAVTASDCPSAAEVGPGAAVGCASAEILGSQWNQQQSGDVPSRGLGGRPDQPDGPIPPSPF